jgi:RNA polymerase sigma factor (sigma-70 family)
MFGAWLRVVARTALSDCRRRRRSFWDMLRRRAQEPDPTTDRECDEEGVYRATEAALTLLDASDRILLEAKYFSGESVNTIAARLGVSNKAVESRLTRARAELRQHFSQQLSRDE